MASSEENSERRIETQIRTGKDALRRLSEIGWSLEGLRRIAYAARTAKNGTTANDVPQAGGSRAYFDCTRIMRELGIEKGWHRDSDGQIESIKDIESGRRFAYCNTDEGTGSEYGSPRNISKKGKQTGAVLKFQQQLFTQAETEIVLDGGHRNLWYICVWVDGTDLRLEVSHPTECKGGYFSEFSERIFVDFDGDQGPISDVSDEDAFSISITKKSA